MSKLLQDHIDAETSRVKGSREVDTPASEQTSIVTPDRLFTRGITTQRPVQRMRGARGGRRLRR